MGKLENLRPFNTLPPEQLREISRKGGKASGAARRKHRDMVEAELAKLCAEEMQLHRKAQLISMAARELSGGGRGDSFRHKYIYKY